MRVIIGLAFILAWSLPASAEQKDCDNAPNRIDCMSGNIKDLNAELTALKAKLSTSGFTLLDIGNTNNNQCIGLQIDTATSPVMQTCGTNIRTQTWIIK